MKPYLLGIDIGTSACKVAVFEKSGTVVAAANGDYPVYYPKEGWAEQNPEEWWSAVCQAVKKAIQKAGIAPEKQMTAILMELLYLKWIRTEMY